MRVYLVPKPSFVACSRFALPAYHMHSSNGELCSNVKSITFHHVVRGNLGVFVHRIDRVVLPNYLSTAPQRSQPKASAKGGDKLLY